MTLYDLEWPWMTSWSTLFWISFRMSSIFGAWRNYNVTLDKFYIGPVSRNSTLLKPPRQSKLQQPQPNLVSEHGRRGLIMTHVLIVVPVHWRNDVSVVHFAQLLVKKLVMVLNMIMSIRIVIQLKPRRQLKPGIKINRVYNIDIAIFVKSILILLGE